MSWQANLTTPKFLTQFFVLCGNTDWTGIVVAMFVNGSGQSEQSLYRTFHRCFLPSFGSFGKVVSKKIF
jgi:hypothetical protein